MIVNPQIFVSGGESQNFSFNWNGTFRYPAVVTVPNTVGSMTAGLNAFQYHAEVEKITFESGGTLRYFPASTFTNCTGLKEITLPDSLIGLQGLAFNNCEALETVRFAENQKITVGVNEFCNCYALTQQSLEDILSHLASGQTLIPSGMFVNCRAITELILPSQIVTLNGFGGCTALESAELPSVTTVGAGVFSGCTSLKTLKYGAVLNSNSTPYINHSSSSNVIFGCTALEDVQIPSGWTENMNLSFTSVLTHDSMVAMIANLYDYSGGTAHTLTLGATNLARLSDAEKAVASAKNWTLA